MISLPRALSVLRPGILLLVLTGCGAPSKDEICGDCSGQEEKKCRTSYDICKLAAYCRVSMLKNKCD